MTQSYLSQTNSDIEEMLKKIGINSVDELFKDIPNKLQYPEFTLPKPLCEPELLESVKNSALNCKQLTSFIGGGSYSHFIPAAVDSICSRSEFYTAYTPYQAEVSQGTLQVIYEFQSMICALTGLDVANASLYDGASAVAEAALVAGRITRKSKLLVSPYVHPNYIKVLETYLSGTNFEITKIPALNGITDIKELKKFIDKETAGVIIQQPNFLGCLEPVDQIVPVVKDAGALVISVVNPITLGILKSPGEFGADIAVGEGQPLGIPSSFGGPGLGFMAVKDKLKRAMPGRIIGQTTDTKGRRGFVLTLQTREQHIRREKATSNICTNQGLCALAATVYMSLMGPEGFRTVGKLNVEKSHKVFEQITEIDDIESFNDQPFFNEFVVRIKNKELKSLVREAAEAGIGLGIDLGEYYPEMENCLLMCVTETVSDKDISKLVEFLSNNI